ncbi:hypothetical protein CFP56_025004 [Quercus suber]|uniref:Uncharacterized protein n=1 Tax=Quercus suber TaxID=58331 RepID=A0AAW0LZX6_QUESU
MHTEQAQPQASTPIGDVGLRLISGLGCGDGGRPNTASIFVGGFVLGGMVVGTLGCIYAPQISKALAGVDRKDLMRKLPKFIYDEEKALEVRSCSCICNPLNYSLCVTRKILTEKIAQLNSAIDDVSAHLHGDDAPNGAIVNSDEVGASMWGLSAPTATTSKAVDGAGNLRKNQLQQGGSTGFNLIIGKQFRVSQVDPTVGDAQFLGLLNDRVQLGPEIGVFHGRNLLGLIVSATITTDKVLEGGFGGGSGGGRSREAID